MLRVFRGLSSVDFRLRWLGFFHNLVPVLLGNIVGGSMFVGLVYHLIYQRIAKTGEK